MKRTTENKRANQESQNLCAPSMSEVKQYFLAKGLQAKAAEDFYQYCKFRKWKTESGRPIRNWKAVANSWIGLRGKANSFITIEIKLKLQFPTIPQAVNDGR